MLRPNILIWKITVSDKETGETVETIYFLSNRRARKFWIDNQKDYEKYNGSIGFETLWLW